MNEPTAEDWLKVGNDMRLVMGLPLLNHVDRVPTGEELEEYNDVVFGAADVLRQTACDQMLHRQKLERRIACRSKLL